MRPAWSPGLARPATVTRPGQASPQASPIALPSPARLISSKPSLSPNQVQANAYQVSISYGHVRKGKRVRCSKIISSQTPLLVCLLPTLLSREEALPERTKSHQTRPLKLPSVRVREGNACRFCGGMFVVCVQSGIVLSHVFVFGEDV